MCTISVTVKHSGDNCESAENNKGPRIDPCGTPCKIKRDTAENLPTKQDVFYAAVEFMQLEDDRDVKGIQ